jgi:prepilin-type N-terminal cleavage/methylation domain-containing protein
MKRDGFTLIEILVVIAVIGLLSSIVMVNLGGSSRQKARIAEGKRLSASLDHILGIDALGKWSFVTQASVGTDQSGQGNNGSLQSGAVWKDRATCDLQLEGCLELDGVSSYMDIKVMSIPKSVTVAAWIKTTAGGEEAVVSNRNPSQYGAIMVGIQSKKPFVWDNSAGGGAFRGDTVVADGTWHHIVFVSKADSGAVWYVDGKLDVSGSLNRNASTGNVRIGYDTSNPAVQSFPGMIDEVRIFGTEFTTGQVNQLYVESLSRHVF